MTAVPPLTEAQARTVARFEEAPHDESSAVERVARALWEADAFHARSYGWDDISEGAKRNFYRLAQAALSAMKGSDTHGGESS